ncbi:hypothetical protein [Sulfurihydrogenibium subterraneum]|uniref:hypothetical protein n=1 Tax=Sulfurihydrogenibium subterraneum TaxID=171121 RepID=UPI00048CB16E|nr:hypothetical protein [Sulfurihydrogenibium subterraneum]
MDVLNIILKVEEKNPLDISNLKQCDPYSSFGVFCNADSFIEGIVIIVGVALMFGASMWFVKKNQESVQREKEDKQNDA